MGATKTAEGLQEKAQALRARLREKGGAMAGPDLRSLRKKIRRVQRRRRKLLGAKPKTPAAGEPKSA